MSLSLPKVVLHVDVPHFGVILLIVLVELEDVYLLFLPVHNVIRIVLIG